MHRYIWTTAVYLFVSALVVLTGVAVLAIWGFVPKEFIWKACASAGVLALFLLSIASALRGLRTEHEQHTSHDTTIH